MLCNYDKLARISFCMNIKLRETFCRLVCLETIEERVLALQRIKQTLAKDVLEG